MKRNLLFIGLIIFFAFIMWLITYNLQTGTLYSNKVTELKILKESELINPYFQHYREELGGNDDSLFPSQNGRYLIYPNNNVELVFEDLQLKAAEKFSNGDLSKYGNYTDRVFIATIYKWSRDSRYFLFAVDNDLFIFDIDTKIFKKISSNLVYNEGKIGSWWKDPNRVWDPYRVPEKNYGWFGDRIFYLCHNNTSYPPELCIISANGDISKQTSIDIQNTSFQKVNVEKKSFPFRFLASPSGKYAVVYTGNFTFLINQDGDIIKPLDITLYESPYSYLHAAALKVSFSPDEKFLIYLNKTKFNVAEDRADVVMDLIADRKTEIIYTNVHWSSELTWTEKGIFIENYPGFYYQADSELIKVYPQSLKFEKIDLPHVDLSYKSKDFRTFSKISSDGRFIVEVSETDPVQTMAGKDNRYIRLALKDSELKKSFELMRDDHFDGGEEYYKLWFTNSTFLQVIKEVIKGQGEQDLYFVYSIDLNKLSKSNS